MKIFSFHWSWRSWDVLSRVESASSLMTGFTVQLQGVGEVVSRSGFINIIRNYIGNIQTSTTLMQSSSTREISSYQIFQVEESLSKVTFISIWSLRPTSLAVRNSGYAMSGKNEKYLVTTRQGKEGFTDSLCFILP